jgi:hypothetical protein
METDRRLLAPLLGLVAVLGILGYLCSARWPYEYRGVLTCPKRMAIIPEEPPIAMAFLATASGTYGLAFPKNGPDLWKWLAQAESLNGQEVVVHGTRPVWRRRFRARAQVIEVYDLKPSPSPAVMTP